MRQSLTSMLLLLLLLFTTNCVHTHRKRTRGHRDHSTTGGGFHNKTQQMMLKVHVSLKGYIGAGCGEAGEDEAPYGQGLACPAAQYGEGVTHHRHRGTHTTTSTATRWLR